MYLKKTSTLTTTPAFAQPQQTSRRKQLKHNVIVFSPRKQSSDGLRTCFETFPQGQFQKQYGNSLQFERQQSICPSIQNGMLDNLLEDLKEEIKLKSEALGKAESYILVMQEEMENLMKSRQELLNRLRGAQKRNEELESQLYFLRNFKTDEMSKRSIPKIKTYVTERNIQIEEPSNQLKLISKEIFNEFVGNFQAMINQLSQWTIRQREEEIDSNFFNKLQAHRNQIQDFLYSKLDDQYSKTTLQTLQLESNRKKNSLYSSSSYNEYEQVIDMYKEHCRKLQIYLCESVNCIQELSKNFQKTHLIHSSMSPPDSLIPKDLVKIIIKECKSISYRKFAQLKRQNRELNNILNEMIEWISKNVKDGSEFLRQGRR